MNRKIEEFDGLIISEVNYSESSKILNVLTDKYGVIGVISKGCRNIKSKLRGVSRKLVYGRFNVYYKSDGLSTNTICESLSLYIPSIIFLVVPLTLEVIANFIPIKLLSKVDFPTLGLPTILTNPHFI